MAERKRKDYLDIAKGIAMLWIISVHADGAPYTGTVGYVVLIRCSSSPQAFCEG